MGWVRHGRTSWNAEGKIQGQTDIPLNEEGRSQAHKLAERLAKDEMKWDAVVSSDLQRARETGRVIADQLSIPLLAADVRLRERGFGEIEGTTEAERLERWGAAWRTTYEGQESNTDVTARGMAFIQDMMSLHPHLNLLVVTHGSFLSQMLHSLCENLDDSYIGNMSYSILELREGAWSSLLHNCSLHLQE
ncbi:histidine phosphatase family protein [Paenibacillus daejeonensis]|uniref:histidine phosphatase family protein n=1 Tax=Paenibacillus daejeonensis TaxID=135193 RepID=UPI000378CF04